VLTYAILLGRTLWIAFPLYWLVLFPFKRSLDVFGRSTYIPFVDFTPRLDAFQAELEYGSDAALALTNSITVSVASAAIAVVIGGMAGYALARFRYRTGPVTNGSLATMFLAQRMVPVAILATPYLILFRTLNLLDSQIALTLAEIGFGIPFAAWLTRNSFVNVPREVEDSALVDGCSRLQLLRHIVLPLGRPALVVAFTLVFLSAWNDYVLALVITFSQSITLPPFIQLQVVYLKDVTNWPNVAAVVLLSVVPPVIIGIALCRYIGEGLTSGVAPPSAAHEQTSTRR
jgi:multiple sugar transport system permease protein